MYNSAKQLQRVLTAREIRKTFIDYFTISHEHKFVRSSPVVPFCDPTVAFVNAGMNQFKSVFLGTAAAPHKRVVNSQKCVRVGGKHNDLSVVGQDGYHHTFFEMLGNWSFGDYFKREACSMALELLRGPYNIDTRRLYVTYFAGDKVLGIPADLECFEIWRSLGFPSSRILPFGCQDNFWEMGTTGPCGPCTEIHLDHHPELASVGERAKLVNAGRSDLTELWNLVFIQYNRHSDGSITQLPSHHVDTGMGFERLTAILQNKSSNYDTDLFTAIFDGIHQLSRAPAYTGSFQKDAVLDTSYRILADHARMITACLADGMLPDQNQKLRRVLRKALNLSEHVFAQENLLSRLVPIVVETLGEAYPEMSMKQSDVIELINHEHDVYKNLRESSSKAFAEVLTEFPKLDDIDLMECPGFVPAYREFQVQRSKFNNNTIPGDFLYKLTDTYGLTEESFVKLAELENMNCDLERYRAEVSMAKSKTKKGRENVAHTDDDDNSIADAQIKLTQRLSISTDNSPKYSYHYDQTNESYELPQLKTRVLGLLLNAKEVNSIGHLKHSDTISIVTEASNFYYESGGQEEDKGHLLVRSKEEDSKKQLQVESVKHLNNCVVHICRLGPSETESALSEEFQLSLGDEVELLVDAEHRQLNTCHHTATHLLNAAIRCLFNKVTYQVSSSVTSEQCKLELAVLGKRLQKTDVELIEDLINRLICLGVPVEVDQLNAAQVLQQNDITMVPGEVYPEQGLRLVQVASDELKLLSKELCCGTHVTNTRELSCFCIVNLKQTNRARFAFTAVAGQAAEHVLKTAALLRHRVDVLAEQFQKDKLTNATEVELQTIRHNMLHTDIKLPYAFKMDTLERINEMLKRLKETSRTTLKEFVEVEMRNLIMEKPLDTHPFILHYITSSALVEEIPLQRATKLCTDRPILVVSMCDGYVKARCCVPQSCLTKDFNATTWLSSFAVTFKGQVAAPKGQNAQLVCNMKSRKVSNLFEEQLEQALTQANKFAKLYL